MCSRKAGRNSRIHVSEFLKTTHIDVDSICENVSPDVAKAPKC